MVLLPPQFVSIMHPGYFWNLQTKTLFSIKRGELKELKRTSWVKNPEKKFGYIVSVDGVKKYVSMYDLQSRQFAHDSMIPVQLKFNFNFKFI